MRKQVAIAFLILHTFSFTELHQLARVPVLLNHFKEHQAIKSTINFFEFLSLHYGNSTNAHGDEKSHNQLPFQGHCELSPHTTWIALPSLTVTTNIRPLIYSSSLVVLPSPMLPSLSGNTIWQPPKV